MITNTTKLTKTILQKLSYPFAFRAFLMLGIVNVIVGTLCIIGVIFVPDIKSTIIFCLVIVSVCDIAMVLIQVAARKMNSKVAAENITYQYTFDKNGFVIHIDRGELSNNRNFRYNEFRKFIDRPDVIILMQAPRSMLPIDKSGMSEQDLMILYGLLCDNMKGHIRNIKYKKK